MIVISRLRWRHLIGAGFLVLGGASTANAQNPDLLAQVSVTPLPGEADCYAGTAGEDHTIFLRNLPPQTGFPDPLIEVCDDETGRRPPQEQGFRAPLVGLSWTAGVRSRFPAVSGRWCCGPKGIGTGILR